jgi:hypothetical protein
MTDVADMIRRLVFAALTRPAPLLAALWGVGCAAFTALRWIERREALWVPEMRGE